MSIEKPGSGRRIAGRQVTRVLRTAGGIVIGYAVMVVLITLVQETWFGGVSLGKSSAGVLTAAGLLTSLAASTGSVAATVIARPKGRIAAVAMACVVVVETTVLVTTGRVSGPLWFDLVAAASLIASILIGAEMWLRLGRWRGSSRAMGCVLATLLSAAGWGRDAPGFLRPGPDTPFTIAAAGGRLEHPQGLASEAR